jgi:hypothetical protein
LFRRRRLGGAEEDEDEVPTLAGGGTAPGARRRGLFLPPRTEGGKRTGPRRPDPDEEDFEPEDGTAPLADIRSATAFLYRTFSLRFSSNKHTKLFLSRETPTRPAFSALQPAHVTVGQLGQAAIAGKFKSISENSK